MSNLYAHSPPDGGTKFHLLKDHLLAVSELAAKFGEKFGYRGLARFLGLAHDLGKADPRFQKYLTSAAKGKKEQKCPHSSPSAKAVYDQLQMLSLPIVCHHTGLKDLQNVKTSLLDADAASVEAASHLLADFDLSGFSENLLPGKMSKLEAEFLIRMIFSCLVDADYLDTEAHFFPHLSNLRVRSYSFSKMSHDLKCHLKIFENNGGPVNLVRKVVLRHCQEAAKLPQGAFRLAVPTGGGKTLASLSFAIEHAKKHSLDRVIVAVPFTTIIDQTALVFDSIFESNTVLEHHSGVEVQSSEESPDIDEVKRQLGTENWDAPIVLTTNVQLFESIFGSKTSKCRKLHNIARSVIILDEVQSLPAEFLEPILDCVSRLISDFGCSIVFCTATQPDFSAFDKMDEKLLKILTQATNIVPETEQVLHPLDRVDYEALAEPLSHEKTAEFIAQFRTVLCIVNSKRDASLIAKLLGKDKSVLHLSTLMCPHHRKKILKNIKRRLKKNLPVKLISTQLIEAGVDVDFPVVMRAMGPFDSIIQAAGRCNREGLLQDKGRCIIFDLENEKSPKGSYKTGTDLARILIGRNPQAAKSSASVSKYFQDFYKNTSTDSKHIQSQRGRLAFEQVAKEFKMIDETTTQVVAFEYDPSAVQNLLDEFPKAKAREWFQAISQYSVGIYETDKKKLERSGFLKSDHQSGLAVYTGPYSQLLGIDPDAVLDPAGLVV